MKTDRFMKNMKIALLLMAVGLMSVSCEEEKLDTSMRIPGLGGEEYIPNEIGRVAVRQFYGSVQYRSDLSLGRVAGAVVVASPDRSGRGGFRRDFHDGDPGRLVRALRAGRGRCVSEEDDAQASSAGR